MGTQKSTAPFERYLTPFIRKDLAKKMVFLGGPRQVGKTTLATWLLNDTTGYLNWDISEDRTRILANELPDTDMWVFDELHKYKKWRRWLKGLFDKKIPGKNILVTGSARLDFYRHGGDSLQGRYHYWRMHPLSVAELGLKNTASMFQLMKLGGFPEPYFSESEIDAKRWSREYRMRLVQDDILSLEQIHDTGTLELLVMRLPELVGSPLSINALREDLQVNHRTVERWVSVLERMYALFRVSPFGSAQIRAVKKERKHYHFDWTLVQNEGARFENMVACHLLKWVHFIQDSEGRDVELRYFRDVYKKEIDFVLTENNKPIRCIECKLSDKRPEPVLALFRARYPNCEAIQVVADDITPFVTPNGVRVMPAIEFLQTLA